MHPSAAKQRLLERKECLVDGEDIVLLSLNKILHNDVHLGAVGERIPRASDKITRLIEIELQRYSKGQGCILAGLVGGIVADLREMLAIYIRPFVYLRITLSLEVNEPKQRLRKCIVDVVQ